MKHKHFLFCLLISLLAMPGKGAEVLDKIWQLAQEAYTAGDYTQAEAHFTRILRVDPKSIEAMYNLGNCHLAQEDLGNAILWYERALKYDPTDRDVRDNLTIARARRDNSVVEIKHFFLLRWMRTASHQSSPFGWAILSLVFLWGTVFLIAKSILNKSWVEHRVRVVVLGCAFFLAIVFGGQRYTDLQRTDQAIVIGSNTALYIAPEQESKRVSNLGAGEKVMILDSLQQFYKVRLANFEQGWLEKTTITKI